MIAVAYHTYRSIAIDQDLAQFTTRHFQHRIFFFLVRQLGRSTGAAHQLSTLAGLHFDIMHVGAQRHMFHLQSIAHFRSHIISAGNGGAHL
jgi:hypothetical protein